jgi:hypothetical protein
MATPSSAWTGEKPRKAGNGAGRGSAAQSGEKVVSISPAGAAKTSVPGLRINRAAYSPAEFAALCGRHPSWAYRLLYGGKVNALTDLGRILIPASELERILSGAAPYNPKPRKPETHSAESGATIGRDA